MEMLRSGFQAVGLSSGDSDRNSGAPSSAETIERLVDRLNSSTLLEDRRDACRALKGELSNDRNIGNFVLGGRSHINSTRYISI